MDAFSVDANQCYPLTEVETKGLIISAALFDEAYLQQLPISFDIGQAGRLMLMIERIDDTEESRWLFRRVLADMPQNDIDLTMNPKSQYAGPTIFIYGRGDMTVADSGTKKCLDFLVRRGILTEAQFEPLRDAVVGEHLGDYQDKLVAQLRGDTRSHHQAQNINLIPKP